MNERDDDDLMRTLARLGEWQPPAELGRGAVKRTRQALIDEAIPLRPFQVLRRRKWYVVFGACFGLAIGFLHYDNKPPIYESTVSLVVTKKLVPVGEQKPNPGTRAEDVVAAHIALLRSDKVIDLAIKNAKLNELKTFEGIDPHQRISASFLVSRAAKLTPGVPNNIIVTSYRGPVAEDCKQILDGILAAFDECLDRENQGPVSLRPTQIGVKVAPVAFQSLTMGLLLGLSFGIGLAYLVTVAARSFPSRFEP